MTDCKHLIDDLNLLTGEQVGLALLADTAPVAAMHIDLALFGAEQARLAERLCDDG